MEKGQGTHHTDEAIHATAIDNDGAPSVEMKDARMLEASEVYGNYETAEKYGYVSRG